MKDRSVSNSPRIERDVDDAPFTMIPNDLLADTGISWKAKGVISYLLGKPGNWKARAKDIERHGNGGAAEVMTALRELRTAGYARLERHTEKGKVIQFVLKISNKRKFTEDNGEIVRFADGKRAKKPLVENRLVDSPQLDSPLSENRLRTNKEGTNKEVTNNQGHKVPLRRCAPKGTLCQKSGSSRTAAPSAAGGASGAAVDFTPSALLGASAPKPPSPPKAATPESKTQAFITEFKTWGNLAGLPVAVTPKDKQSVEEFFRENTDYQVRWLTTILLGAWIMDPKAEDKDTGRLKFWYCTKKGRRVFTFMKHLTEIQDELGWDGSEKQIAKVAEIANWKFKEQGQKLYNDPVEEEEELTQEA